MSKIFLKIYMLCLNDCNLLDKRSCNSVFSKRQSTKMLLSFLKKKQQQTCNQNLAQQIISRDFSIDHSYAIKVLSQRIIKYAFT